MAPNVREYQERFAGTCQNCHLTAQPIYDDPLFVLENDSTWNYTLVDKPDQQIRPEPLFTVPVSHCMS